MKKRIKMSIGGIILSMLVGVHVSGQVNRAVTGVVRDASNAPLAGVTVSVKGGKAARQTDAAGTFSID